MDRKHLGSIVMALSAISSAGCSFITGQYRMPKPPVPRVQVSVNYEKTNPQPCQEGIITPGCYPSYQPPPPSANIENQVSVPPEPPSLPLLNLEDIERPIKEQEIPSRTYDKKLEVLPISTTEKVGTSIGSKFTTSDSGQKALAITQTLDDKTTNRDDVKAPVDYPNYLPWLLTVPLVYFLGVNKKIYRRRFSAKIGHHLSRQSVLYKRYDPTVLKIPVPDTASFLAGVYQGYMNAAGLPMPLDNASAPAAVLGGLAIMNYLSARFKSPYYNGRRANPDWVATKQVGRGTIINSLEMTVGYGLGQAAYRVLN